MDEIRVSAKTVDDALTEALIQLRTTSDQVEYEIVEKGSTGFLGIGAKQAVISVRKKRSENTSYKEEKKDRYTSSDEKPYKKQEKKDIKKTVKTENKETKATAKTENKETKKVVKAEIKEEKKETKTEKQDNIKNANEVEKTKKFDEADIKELTEKEAKKVSDQADKFLSDVFTAMSLEVKIDIEVDEKKRLLNIDLSGENMGLLIGKHGQNLNSLEYLVRLVINKNHHGEDYIHIKLDTENYRKRRKTTLESLARNMAYKVKRSRRSVSLEPMNPYERRVIHSALQHDKYVETHSEGNEPNRRVVITLK